MRAAHERWDGYGYPDGLAGDEIPLEARIAFACDALHAMTSDRPYRARLSDEEALKELAANAGSQFDPAVIAALLKVWAQYGGSARPDARRPRAAGRSPNLRDTREAAGSGCRSA